MEGDSNSHSLVLISQYLAPEKCSHQGCHSLLAIDQNPLASRRRAVFESDRWVPPGNQVANRITAVERIQQVPHFGGFPHKRALDLWDRDFSGFDPSEQGLDGMWSY